MEGLTLDEIVKTGTVIQPRKKETQNLMAQKNQQTLLASNL